MLTERFKAINMPIIRSEKYGDISFRKELEKLINKASYDGGWVRGTGWQ